MGYFSNGTEGDLYEEEYCSKCAHVDGCAVWDAHMLHNYQECNKEDSILHVLIPLHGSPHRPWNGKCRMFIDKEKTVTIEVKYADVKVLIGKDDDGDWQADTADDAWCSTNGIIWAGETTPLRLVLMVPETPPQVTTITLPELPEGEPIVAIQEDAF